MHNYKLAFEEACAFTEVAEILEHEGNKVTVYTPEHAVVAITNSAFAIELYLKSYLYLNGVEIKKEHNLLSLWNKCAEVNSSFTDAISDSIQANNPNWDLPTEEQLERHQEAFIEWRYRFEDGNRAFVDRMFLRALRMILRDATCREIFGRPWLTYKDSNDRDTVFH